MRKQIGSAAFDVFCTANFLNFVPWQASIDYLLSIGIAVIKEHNLALFENFAGEIDETKYRLIGPSEKDSRSTIVTVSHVDGERNRETYDSLARAGVDVALRSGNLRFWFHLYNTADQIGRAIALLNSA